MNNLLNKLFLGNSSVSTRMPHPLLVGPILFLAGHVIYSSVHAFTHKGQGQSQRERVDFSSGLYLGKMHHLFAPHLRSFYGDDITRNLLFDWLRRSRSVRSIMGLINNKLHPPYLQVQCLDMLFEHPVGLAPGLVVNGDALPGSLDLGASFVECGTVSAYPHNGTPTDHQFVGLPQNADPTATSSSSSSPAPITSFLDNTGHPNVGFRNLYFSLQQWFKQIDEQPLRIRSKPIGINLGLMPSSSLTEVPQHYSDYLQMFALLYPVCHYTVINIDDEAAVFQPTTLHTEFLAHSTPSTSSSSAIDIDQRLTEIQSIDDITMDDLRAANFDLPPVPEPFQEYQIHPNFSRFVEKLLTLRHSLPSTEEIHRHVNSALYHQVTEAAARSQKIKQLHHDIDELNLERHAFIDSYLSGDDSKRTSINSAHSSSGSVLEFNDRTRDFEAKIQSLTLELSRLVEAQEEFTKQQSYNSMHAMQSVRNVAELEMVRALMYPSAASKMTPEQRVAYAYSAVAPDSSILLRDDGLPCQFLAPSCESYLNTIPQQDMHRADDIVPYGSISAPSSHLQPFQTEFDPSTDNSDDLCRPVSVRFQDPTLRRRDHIHERLKTRFQRFEQRQGKSKILFKIAADIEPDLAILFAQWCTEVGIDGLIVSGSAVNRAGVITTPSDANFEQHKHFIEQNINNRPSVSRSQFEYVSSLLGNSVFQPSADLSPEKQRSQITLQHQPGYITGEVVKQHATKLLATIHHHTQGQLPLIGSGGITSGRDVLDKIHAGASLVQVHSVLYEDIAAVGRITNELAQLVKEEFDANNIPYVEAISQSTHYLATASDGPDPSPSNSTHDHTAVHRQQQQSTLQFGLDEASIFDQAGTESREQYWARAKRFPLEQLVGRDAARIAQADTCLTAALRYEQTISKYKRELYQHACRIAPANSSASTPPSTPSPSTTSPAVENSLNNSNVSHNSQQPPSSSWFGWLRFW